MRKIDFIDSEFGYAGKSPTGGNSYRYKVYFSGTWNEGEERKLKVKLSCTNGKFYNGTKSIDLEVNNEADYSFSITWDNVSADAVITAASDKDTKKLNVKIQKAGIKIDGPSQINYGDAVTYNISTPNSDLKLNTIQWEVDSRLEVVGVTNQRSLTVKAKENVTSSLLKGLKVTVTSNFGTFSENKDINILFSAKAIKITTPSSVVGENSIISYELIGLPSTGYLITWQSIANATLLSGQFSRNATFKVSSNGYAKVKAQLLISGMSYSIENSSVWVGKPAKPTSIEGFPSGVLPARTNINIATGSTGATEFIWSVSGYGKLLDGINSGYGVRIQTGAPEKKNGEIFVRVKAKNKCGESEEILVVKNVKSVSDGGLYPPIVEV